MIGVTTGIKVRYLRKGIEKTGIVNAFKYIDMFAELYINNGDVIMEQEVIEEIKE